MKLVPLGDFGLFTQQSPGYRTVLQRYTLLRPALLLFRHIWNKSLYLRSSLPFLLLLFQVLPRLLLLPAVFPVPEKSG